MINYINVKQFGAAGNGQQDDSAAVKRAVQAMQDQYILYFPSGTYRIQTLGTPVEIAGLSNIAIVFESEATLLMDNLNTEQQGSGHAFYFKGPAENLLIEGASIKWNHRPSTRSKGDGIRIDGPCSNKGPSNERTFKNITIKDCSIENSPQTGMILMGCSNIQIENIQLKNTHADGIHLNACQHFTVNTTRGEGLGDDNVALVTYYNADTTNYTLYKNQYGPYSQPSLGEWSNFKGSITNVESYNQKGANCIRVAGASSVNISNVRARQRKAGIIVDAGKKGNTFGWSYQASRSIEITNVTADECHVGIHVMSFNANPSEKLFWDFDVTIRNVLVRDCQHDNVLVEKCSGIQLFNIHSEGRRIRLINLNNVVVNNLQNNGGSIVIHGTQKLKKKHSDDIVLDGVLVFGGNLQIENAAQVDCTHLHAYNTATDTGIVLANIRNMQIDSLVSKNARRRGIQIVNCQQLSVASVFIEASKNRFTSLEIGGGDAASKSEDISIISGIYKNDAGRADISLQTGAFAPKNVSIQMSYNTLKKNKVWKNYRLNPDKARFKSIE
ncbi:MAG: glycosyl hydrolase family 28-related protein [Bacteroidota bacterium]